MITFNYYTAYWLKSLKMELKGVLKFKLLQLLWVSLHGIYVLYYIPNCILILPLYHDMILH